MIRNALGELANMVARNFKPKIANLADLSMLSVPSVITGEGYSLEAVDPCSCIRADFDYAGNLIDASLAADT